MATNQSKIRTVMTLCLLRKDNSLLMGLKKLRWGAGNYNGFGGKLEPRETLEECIIREVKEESGLDLLKFEKRGVMSFEWDNNINEVHIFEGISWSGEPVETEEMAPIWLEIDNLPYNKMWSSDKTWHPYFFKREQFEGWVSFDKNHQVLDYKIVKID